MKLKRITPKLTGGKSKKGISFEMRTFFSQYNLPTGKKRACFWRTVERCVIRLNPV